MISRRDFLTHSSAGLGGLAWSTLMAQSSRGAIAAHGPAKSVIWLFMNGGPSHIDLFDPKPELERWDGKLFPGDVDTLFPFPGPVMKSPFRFRQHGDSGAWVSELFPHLARHVDDIAFIRSCTTEAKNHGAALYNINTGSVLMGAPHVGAWATYGLGTENDDLPGFIAMFDHRSCPETGVQLWGSGFLPGQYGGVTLRPADPPVLYSRRPDRYSPAGQAVQIDLVRQLNDRHAQRLPNCEELHQRSRALERAFRMQVSIPELTNIQQEDAASRRLYGIDDPPCRYFGTQLLMARRMVERGVRFIQIYHGGAVRNWDQHSRLRQEHAALSYETDRPIAGLLQDLKQRGLLDSTLVVWGGEFGRTPTSQDFDGRDHNPHGFTMWMAGGGIRGGTAVGATDEFGCRAVERPVTVHDVHATILNRLGIDAEQLSFRFGGRDQTLTNGLGKTIGEVLS
ncbi:MAG: hypothetical protein KatS3mg111_2535 [Pirellulaceae bacterium]|nr:MAG: hypothetical protein KatS3mg111_2535 [Pirellulaceae bacterium]